MDAAQLCLGQYVVSFSVCHSIVVLQSQILLKVARDLSTLTGQSGMVNGFKVYFIALPSNL